MAPDQQQQTYNWSMTRIRILCASRGVVLAVLALAGFALRRAEACSCMPSPQCELPSGYELVFIGKVTSKQLLIPVTVPGNELPSRPPPVIVTFAVSEYLHGQADREVRIHTTEGCCACGYKFTESVEYLVFASDDGGKWATNICTPTRPLRTASALIEQLRAIGSNARVAQIFGFVGRVPQDPRFESIWKTDPLEGVRIRVVGRRGNFESVTSSTGAYAFRGLPADSYYVQASLPSGLTTFPSPTRVYEVGTDTRGCEADIRVLADGRLTGSLVDEYGRPVRGLVRALIVSDEIEPLLRSVVSHETNSDGKFRLPFLAPGKYRIVASPERGGHIDDTVRFYYPGTGSENDAYVFELQMGEHIDTIRFVIPEHNIH